MSEIESIMEQLRPLYQQLHAYVRYTISQRDTIRLFSTNHIPAHTFGELWILLPLI